jgi:hypothetical protein
MSETLIVEFGAGKVGVMRTSEQGEDFESGIAFVHQEAHPIGEVVPGRIGKNTDEVGSFLRFHFSNSKSVQVLIDDLVVVRESMKAVEQNAHLTGGWLCAKCGSPLWAHGAIGHDFIPPHPQVA